jgi:hypothetical protein
MPEQHPSDAELHRIVYGDKLFVNDGSPDEPDEIAYEQRSGTWVTTRDERARATQIWHEEEQLPHPDNAVKNLERTENMLRFRLKHMGVSEIPDQIAADLTTTHEERIRQAEQAAAETAVQNDDWVSSETGQFVPPPESRPNEPAPSHEYTGRHRRPGMRVPLHRLIRHGIKGYKSRHAAN